MSAFVTDREVFSRIALREDEYEALIPRFLLRDADDWLWARWNPMLEGRYGRTKPDALLVSKDLSRWCVVEVELVSHPEDHFRSQFERIESAHYGAHLAASAARALGLPLDAELRVLFATEHPELLCVADGGSEVLASACRDFGFQLAIGVPYRSDLGAWAIEWTRIPAMLRERPSGPEYPVQISTQRWGGKYFVQVPANFPQVKSILMRIDDVEHQVAVRNMAGTRRILLPERVGAGEDQALRLKPIDPGRSVYELVNGVIQS